MKLEQLSQELWSPQIPALSELELKEQKFSVVETGVETRG
jgi:hypothetical protein